MKQRLLNFTSVAAFARITGRLWFDADEEIEDCLPYNRYVFSSCLPNFWQERIIPGRGGELPYETEGYARRLS